MHDSVAARRRCSFMNYFLQMRICHFHSSPKDPENKPWHCWPYKRESGKTQQHNVTYPCAEFNLQNTPVQLGGWFRVKGIDPCSSWQLRMFNLRHGTAADFLSRMSGPASICLREALFFQIHEYHILEASKWPFESFPVAFFLGKAAFPVTEGRFTIQLNERVAFPFLSQICSF